MALLFQEVLDKYFPRVDRLVELINGKRKDLTYMHEEMMRTEYCPTQTFNSSQFNNINVSASWVDIDSPLPVMKRDGIKVTSNDLPIFGMKIEATQKQLNDLQIMKAQGAATEDVLSKLMNDAVKCTNGMKEAVEGAFLQGLCEGGCCVPAPLNSDNYNKKDFRIDYGYLYSNKFGVAIKWEDENADPIADIENVLDKATTTLSYMFISKKTFNAFRKNQNVRRFVANKSGVVVVAGATYPVPSSTSTIDALNSEFGLEVKVIDRTIYVEKNGQRSKWNPWNDDKVIFTATTNLGAVAYGRLPEENSPVAGITYSKPLEYALLSRYSHKNPTLTEVTEIIGMVCPIVENVDEIYQLDVTDAQVLDTTAEASDTGDTKLTIYGTAYSKTAVVSALKSVGVSAKSNSTDATLLKLVNELSAEDEAKFKAALA